MLQFHCVQHICYKCLCWMNMKVKEDYTDMTSLECIRYYSACFQFTCTSITGCTSTSTAGCGPSLIVCRTVKEVQLLVKAKTDGAEDGRVSAVKSLKQSIKEAKIQREEM